MDPVTASSDFAYRPAWGLGDLKIIADAKQFWRRLNALGPQEIERRTSEICAAAYKDDAMIGVATAFLSDLEILRARFAVFRCMVEPPSLRQEISSQLALISREQLEKWSLSHPQEKVVGMAAVIPGTEFREKQRQPMWPDGGLDLNLVGFDRAGNQIRIAWFQHARLS